MAIILVVDDEEAIRTLLLRVLTSVGHEVMSVGNGLEAVALFRSYSSRIDLIVTDLKMPVMDGYEFVRTVQHDRPDTKIICMTGYADHAPPKGTMLLEKPFRPDQLNDTISRLMGRPGAG